MSSKFFQTFETRSDSVQTGKDIDNFSYELYINGGFEYTTFDRVYIKVQDLVANVGGFMSLISALVEFVYGFYNENHYYIAMIEKMFNLHFAADELESQKIEMVIVDNNEKLAKNNTKRVSLFANFVKDEKVIQKEEKARNRDVRVSFIGEKETVKSVKDEKDTMK